MKKIIAFILVLILVFSCAACKSVDDEHVFVKIDEYRTHHGYAVWLVYDPETKVEYFMRGDLMCPRYDENGNISFYKGETHDQS